MPAALVEDVLAGVGDDGGNWLIHGENEVALKALVHELKGQVKCCCIDPPYNTGRSFRHYEDRFSRQAWLDFMRARLELIRELLSDDGSLWLIIDDQEFHYLKVLCDDVFGLSNYQSTVTWQKKYSVSNNKRGIASITDFVLVYSKTHAFEPRLIPRSEESLARYKNPDGDPRGPWKAVDYLNQAASDMRPNLCYEIQRPDGVMFSNGRKAWKYSRETHLAHVADNRLWWGKDGKNRAPSLKLFLSDVRNGMIPHNWWPHIEAGHTDEAKKEVLRLFATDEFETPKPERLIKRILDISTDVGDLVLDAFLGSGTTAAVAHKMRRRWVGVEVETRMLDCCAARLRKVVLGDDLGGITPLVGWEGGGGFRVYRTGQ